MKIFTERLRQRAVDLGISNAQAARRVGILERRYANYITGEREPDLDMLAKIARALETTPDYLLGFGETPDKGKRAKLIARLNSAARMLPDNELELVAVQLDALAAQHKKPPFTGL
ncbi:MAG TPA: helix-turn-helix transcriptional regulator [Accumulibacter sp.]|nr:helix-turn-helix transcriptional regulator [Accumulibacter sp.]